MYERVGLLCPLQVLAGVNHNDLFLGVLKFIASWVWAFHSWLLNSLPQDEFLFNANLDWVGPNQWEYRYKKGTNK